jgi:hypothetical protein
MKPHAANRNFKTGALVQKIKLTEFTISGLLIRLGSPTLYSNGWYQRQSAIYEFDLQNKGVHFRELKKKPNSRYTEL